MILRVSFEIGHDRENISFDVARPKISAGNARRLGKFRREFRAIHALLDVRAAEGSDFVSPQKFFARLPPAEPAQFFQRVEVVDEIFSDGNFLARRNFFRRRNFSRSSFL